MDFWLREKTESKLEEVLRKHGGLPDKPAPSISPPPDIWAAPHNVTCTRRYRLRGDHRVKVDVRFAPSSFEALIIDPAKGNWRMDERLFDILFEPDESEQPRKVRLKMPVMDLSGMHVLTVEIVEAEIEDIPDDGPPKE